MDGEVIHSCIPARLDRLPWSRWHWLIVTGLGITWILDGLEVTLAGTLGGVLKQALHMSDAQVGQSATFYLSGAVIGALGFGWATDRLGRKNSSPSPCSSTSSPPPPPHSPGTSSVTPSSASSPASASAASTPPSTPPSTNSSPRASEDESTSSSTPPTGSEPLSGPGSPSSSSTTTSSTRTS